MMDTTLINIDIRHRELLARSDFARNQPNIPVEGLVPPSACSVQSFHSLLIDQIIYAQDEMLKKQSVHFTFNTTKLSMTFLEETKISFKVEGSLIPIWIAQPTISSLRFRSQRAIDDEDVNAYTFQYPTESVARFNSSIDRVKWRFPPGSTLNDVSTACFILPQLVSSSALTRHSGHGSYKMNMLCSIVTMGNPLYISNCTIAADHLPRRWLPYHKLFDLDAFNSNYSIKHSNAYIDVPDEFRLLTLNDRVGGSIEPQMMSMFSSGSPLDGLNSLIDDIKERLPQFDATQNNVNEFVDLIREKAETIDVLKLEAEALSFLKQTRENLDIKKHSLDTMAPVSVVVSISATSYWYFNQNNVTFAAMIGSLLVAVYFNKDRIVSLSKLTLDIIRRNPVEAQAFTSESFSMSLCTFLVAFAGSKQDVKKLPEYILKTLSSFDRIKNSFKGIFEFFVDLVAKLVDYLNLSRFLPASMRIVGVEEDYLREFFLKCEAVFQQARTSEFEASEDNLNILCCLDRNAIELIGKIPRAQSTSTTHMLLLEARSKIKSMIKKVEESGVFAKGERVQPVTVCFTGGPGVGKSQCIEHLCKAILASVLPEDKILDSTARTSQYVYNKAIGSTFDEGYTESCIITTIDEFGQAIDVAGNGDNEYMALIRFVNEFTCILNMAHLESKGSTLFKSKFVFLTTNLFKFRPSSVASVGAVERRIDFPVVVIPKPEYCSVETRELNPMSQKFDHSLLPIGEVGISSLHPKHMLFIMIDYASNQTYGSPMGFDMLVSLVLEKHLFYENCYKQKVIEMRQTFELYSEVRNRGPIQDVDELHHIFGGDIQMESLDEKHDVYGCELKTHAETIPLLNKFILFIESNKDSKLSRGFETLVASFCFSMQTQAYSKYKIAYAFLKKYGPIKLYRACGDDVRYNIELVHEFVREGDFTSNLPMITAPWEANTLSHRYEVFMDKLKVEHIPSMMRAFGKVKDYMVENPHIPIMVTAASALLAAAVPYVRKHKEFYDEYSILRSDLILRTPDTVVASQAEGIKGVSLNYTYPDDGSHAYCNHVREGTSEPQYNPKARPNVKAPPYRKQPLSTQMGPMGDTSGAQRVDSVMNKNMFTLNIIINGKRKKLGYVTFVIGRCILMNHHFMKCMLEFVEDPSMDFDRSSQLELKSANSSEDTGGMFLTFEELWKGYFGSDMSELQDICIIRLPVRFPNRSNILNMFPQHEAFLKIRDCPFRLSNKDNNTVQSFTGTARFVKSYNVGAKHLDELAMAFNYGAYTQQGDCGSLFSYCNKSDQGPKIYGIHCAGNTVSGTGFAAAVYRELIDELLEAISTFDKVHQVDQGDVDPQFGLHRDDILICDAYTATKPAVQMFKSQLMKSEMFEALGPAKEKPAMLGKFMRDGILLDPYQIALSKYCKSPPYIPDFHLELVKDNYRDFLFSVSLINREKCVFTFEEAVVGIEEDPDWNSISRGKSLGYPLNVDKTIKKGRYSFFGNDSTYDLNLPLAVELKKEIEEDTIKMRKGERPEVIYMDNLKDETRPILKVEMGATRLFSACPLKHLIMVRMYFGAFSSWFTKNKIDNGSAIGVNPYSVEWHFIAQKLTRFRDEEPSVGAGDYSGYDGSCIPQIYWKLLDVIQEWYDDDNYDIRRMLWLELVNSRHIVGSNVYDWFSSLPSGHPLTAMINSMYNQFLFRYCWFRANGNDIIELWKFDANVYIIALGDDNVFNVSYEYRDIFNELTLPGLMKECGMTYTSEKKLTSVVKLRQLEEVEFLKRSFRRSDTESRYVGPLNTDTIEQMFNYTKKGVDSSAITFTTVQIAIDEASLHPKEYFNSFVKRINEECYKREFPLPKNTSYMECSKRVCNFNSVQY